MRSVRSLMLVLLCCAALPLLANHEIAWLSPAEFVVNSGERFMSIGITTFTGRETVVAHFNGPAGSFDVLPTGGAAGGVQVWVPQEIIQTPGRHEVHLTVTPPGGTPGDSMPKTFYVYDNGHYDIDLRLPAPIVKEATEAGGAVVNYLASAITKDFHSLPVQCSHPSGSLFPIATTTVTCSSTNGVITVQGQFTVTVRDTTPPVLMLSPDLLLSTTGTDTEVTYTVMATDTVDGDVPVQCVPPSGSFFRINTTIVRCQAVDAHHNSAFGEFKVTVVGTAYTPVIMVPANITVAATGTSGAVVHYTATARSGEDENARTLPVTCTPPSGSTFAAGTTTVTCDAYDPMYETHASKTFQVTVTPPSNTTPPTLHLPPDQTVQATGPNGAVVEYTATATGYGGDDHNGRPLAPVHCTPPSGSTFPLGETTVTCTATDTLNDTSSTGTFRITVVDTLPPDLALPGDRTVQATSSAGATVSWTASAQDLVDGNVAVTCTPPSGSTFAVGSTTVTCSASDSRGNSAGGAFTITVTEAPVLVLPPDQTVEATSAAGAIVTYDVAAGITCTPASGSTFAIAETVVQCTNGAQNGTFQVRVVDTTAPSLALPDDFTVEATGANGAAVTWSASANDLVDGSLTVACTPASGSTFAVGTAAVQCSATDARGNAASGTFDVTVADTTAPSLTLPADIAAETTSDSGAIVSYVATASDLVDGDVAITCGPPSGSVFPIGTTTVSCTAADSRGNGANGMFNVIVTKTGPTDTSAPVIVSITASPDELRPANHKLVDVTITVEATDDTDPAPYSRIFAVTANEAIDAAGSGNTTDYDYNVTGPLTVELRAERSGQGQDRIYRIFIETYDAAGNRTTGNVTVRVPRDGNGAPPQPTIGRRRASGR
jgi:environmental stress-induced protein Ves